MFCRQCDMCMPPDPLDVAQADKAKPVHTSQQRSVNLSRSSQQPTANQGGAECHHCHVSNLLNCEYL